jgi:PAS domain-containing protein
MEKRTGKNPDASTIRRRAEKKLAERQSSMEDYPDEEDPLKLIHELQVHQIELEMQNDELKNARIEVELGLAHYIDIYDFAPVGYVTLDQDGIVQEVNLTCSVLLGEDRSRLLKRDFNRFISRETRSVFMDFLQKVLASNTKKTCDLALVNDGITPRYVHIEAMAIGSGGSVNRMCRMAIINTTDLVQLAMERDQLIRELQQALAEIKTLSGLLPICSYCKKIRDDKGYWNQIESYISRHSDVLFSHSICPECLKIHYPGVDEV